MNQIIKEITETVDTLKSELGVKTHKQALKLAVKMQQNRFIRDLTHTLKQKLK